MQRKAEVSAIESAEAEIAAEKKKRRFYKDRLSLADTSPESLTNYTRHVINERRLGDLIFLAQVNEDQFRILWLLFQYQLFKSNVDFVEAKSLVKKYIESNALGVRDADNIIAPNRRQILGMKRERKIRNFVEYYDYLKRSTRCRFDIFEYALTAPIEDLFCISRPPDYTDEHPLDFVNIIYGQKLKLPAELWARLMQRDESVLKDLYIDLPRTEGSKGEKTVDLKVELLKRMGNESEHTVGISEWL